MRGIIITSGECPPCDEMRKTFADLIKSGEIVEKSIEENSDEVIDLMDRYSLENIPSLVILSDNGELVAAIKDD